MKAQPFGFLYEHVFGTSSQKAVTAQKIPTSVGIGLFDSNWTTSIENSNQYVGTQIVVVTTLYDKLSPAHPLDGKVVEIHYKIDAGAEQKFNLTTNSDTVTGTPSHGGASTKFTLTQAGTYIFWAYYPGDAQYEGCKKTLKLEVKSLSSRRR